MKETNLFLNKILNNEDIIVLGISGGPDSMCLLHVLQNLKDNYNLKLICAHVNHNVRSESEEEKTFVEEYCKKNNIVFEYMKIEEYKNNKFTEAEARRKRYKFFKDIIKKYNAKYLMTAHHGDDLVESVMMRLVRGSTLSGYIGIPKITYGECYDIVRPLLYLTKEDIFKYLKENNIAYVTDKSNESLNYTRNRYRKQLLPFLKEEDKNVHQKFLKYSEELEKYNNYINMLLQNELNKVYVDKKIIVNKLLEYDEFIQEKIIEYVIKDIQKTEVFNVNDKNLQDILNLLHSSKNKSINLADGFIARLSYNYLYIEKNIKVDGYKIEINNDIIVQNKYKFEYVKKCSDKSNNIIRIDSAEIKLPLYIRCKKDGDYIEVKNLGGKKKIKDIFIDNKIDIKKRKNYPLVVDSEDRIIWLPGLKKSTFDKDIKENYDIIIKYTEENNDK